MITESEIYYKNYYLKHYEGKSVIRFEKKDDRVVCTYICYKNGKLSLQKEVDNEIIAERDLGLIDNYI